MLLRVAVGRCAKAPNVTLRFFACGERARAFEKLLGSMSFGGERVAVVSLRNSAGRLGIVAGLR